MARLIMPLMSQDARGSVAGIQYSSNRSGCFGSRKSTSTRAQAGGATNWRANIKAAHTAWHALSEPLRTAWAAIAPAPLTGRNLYIGCALRLLSIGAPAPTADPRSAPARPGIHSFHWNPDTPSEHTHELTFSPRFGQLIEVVCSVHPTWTPSIPHVRKFSFIASHNVDPPYVLLPLILFAPYLALRVQWLDWNYGLLLGERRFVFDPTIEQDLLPA